MPDLGQQGLEEDKPPIPSSKVQEESRVAGTAMLDCPSGTGAVCHGYESYVYGKRQGRAGLGR